MTTRYILGERKVKECWALKINGVIDMDTIRPEKKQVIEDVCGNASYIIDKDMLQKGCVTLMIVPVVAKEAP